LVTYSPCITQVEETVNKIVEHKNLIYYKTVEIIEREWHVKGKKIRPISNALTHSAFLTFSRVV
jgi:tRNA (adenine57-N1/adenine58-N1)-methyltransferase